jgi:hypothetical protein
MKHLILLVTRICGVTTVRGDWANVFLQSPANGSDNRGEDLPEHKWAFPTQTWFQQRLREKR